MITEKTLILGGSSAIAQAIAMKELTKPDVKVIVVSRDTTVYQSMAKSGNNLQAIDIIDYTSEGIDSVLAQINDDNNLPFTAVYICHGILHANDIQPEKKLEDISADAFQKVMTANVVTPMLWIQKLTPTLAGKIPCKLVVLSARVGSISDNRLGGWYSYRASKAALNMALKNTAIEYSRRAKNIKIIAFHPGTTDTYLSKPFQKNVPKNKLFTPDFVANKLSDIVDKTEIDGELSYLDWENKTIPW